MDSTVIQPAPGQAILSTSDHGHWGHGDHDEGHGRGYRDSRYDDLDRIILAEQAAFGRVDAAAHTETVVAVKDGACESVAATKDAFAGTVGAVKDARGDTVIAVKDARGDIVSAIKDARFDLSAVASRDAAAAAVASCKTDSLIGSSFGRVSGDVFATGAKLSAEGFANSNVLQRQICDLYAAQISGFKDAQATAYQVEGRALLEATKNASAVALQAQVNASAVALQNATLASAAQLQAQINACAAAAQLAECCCELKEKISYDGQQTRAILESNEKDRLREKNAECERKLAAYYARGSTPVVPF